MVYILLTKNQASFNSMQLKSIKSLLPDVIIQRANQYQRPADFCAYLLGKYLLVMGLKEFGIKETALHDIQYTPFNRPYLNYEIDFNISHSGDYVLCALSADFKIGIDIEEISNIEISDFFDYFTEQELIKINIANDKYREFFRYWTIKEAITKADGRGLITPLKDIVITSNTGTISNEIWYLTELNIDIQYASHLATNCEITRDKISLQFIPF